MNYTKIQKYRLTYVWRLLFIFCNLSFLLPNKVLAHTTPTTNIILSVTPNSVNAELQIPISELELAFGNNISQNPELLLQKFTPQLKEYVLAHIQTYKNKEAPWKIELSSMQVDKSVQELTKQPFSELVVHLKLIPNDNEDTRNFVLDYSVVMHQVVNHSALVSIKNDWENGLSEGNIEVGIIARDIGNDIIPPFKINLKKGNNWNGFKSLFRLGAEHIKEGTDHLLFLITLLLPAFLVASKNRWTNYVSLRQGIAKIFKIVSAFTVGHSITLLVGALNMFIIPTQLIEVIVAFSIFISAIHCIIPIFYKREILIAAGFGFIHGLAFSQTLQVLNLEKLNLAISVLGFNLGIEAMQLFIVLLTMPWFILLSKTLFFKPIKNVSAILVSIAAIGWILQRTTNTSNFLSNSTDKLFLYSTWLVVGIAIFSLTLFYIDKKLKTKIKTN